MIRTLGGSGLGVGLLHEQTAEQPRRARELEVLAEAAAPVRVLFAHVASRAQDPVLSAAVAILRERTRA